MRTGGKKFWRVRASGLFSAEGVQPAELLQKHTGATCSLGTASVSALRQRGNTGETCVELADCRIFRMLKVKVKVNYTLEKGSEDPEGE